MNSIIRYTKNTLSLCICAALLSACGGSSEQNKDDPIQAAKVTIMGPDANTAYLEPKKGQFSENTIGFYDNDASGATREIRNDLTGSFQGMIQFAQNHTVDPSGNSVKQMPMLTSEKSALLLVTPSTSMGDVEKLNAEIYFNSRLIRRIELHEPSQIPLSDQTNSDRSLVQYTKRAWTATLNWDEVKPGLNIRIVDPNSRKNGRLAAHSIDFAVPGELVVQSIRLGLLTSPPVSSGHYMLNEPEKAATDYFQTIPAAKLTVTKYDDMTLNKVMVASGVIYDTASESEGGYYAGDMRENTAKSTFSTGINLANWGVTSASMSSQNQPQLTQTAVVHHARGVYKNGTATHGLSGGNGILTLLDSVGNEFSHEIGHHYGLGHYPGTVNGNYFWASHHHDSGWGYMAHRNRMRGNINWGVTNLDNRLAGTPIFNNQYAFAPDSMAGGAFSSSLSRYTHYTGYSTYHKIQPAFNKAIWDASSSTGYKLWNASTRQMDVYQPKVPSSSVIWYNSTDGNYLKPVKFGVPVFTILGGYDPVNNVGLLYPAARGNWGNTFNLPQADTSLKAQSCWAHITYASKAAESIALSPTRLGSNANKLHINIAQSDNPQQVDLYCKKAGSQAVKLSTITIPKYETPLPEAVIVGKQYGFKALRRIELPQLERDLIANAGKPFATLSASSKILYESYKDDKSAFSPEALAELERYTVQEEKLTRLDQWLNAYRSDLASSNNANAALQNFVGELGFPMENPMQGATMFVMPNMSGACLKAEITQGATQPSIFMSGKNGCTGSDDTLWIYDAMGKIHSVKYPEYCLSGSSLAKCNNSIANQFFDQENSGNLVLLKRGNQCLDLSSGRAPGIDGRGSLTTYSCTGGNNQKWTAMTQSTNFLLSATSSQNLPVLVKAFSNN
jgi:hypothetical protein